MIKRYVFGDPVETESVLWKPEAADWQDDRLFCRDNAFYGDLSGEEIVYGLGQNVRGINKRGWLYCVPVYCTPQRPYFYRGRRLHHNGQRRNEACMRR